MNKTIHLLGNYMPQVLVLQLKRFTSTLSKKRTPVLFPFNEDLDLSEYVNAKETKYRLFGVINHSGVCGGGHYTAYAKCKDKVWRKFNDRTVSVIEHVPDNLETDAYLLFFEKI